MRFAGLLALGAAAGIGLGGCTEGTMPTGPVDLTGSYTLQSIQIAGQTEPNSSGTLQLTGSTYDLALTVNGQVDPEDVGSYQISGTDSWSQTSSTQGVQSTGTYTLVGTTLTISLTSPQSSVSVWSKVEP